MDSSTTSGRIIRGILAGTLAAAAGIGLAACQSAAVAPAPAPVVFEDPLVDQQRVEQAADRMRERYAGRPADRVEEALAREEAVAIDRMRDRYSGRPADRVEEELAREEADRLEQFRGRPADRVEEELARDAQS